MRTFTQIVLISVALLPLAQRVAASEVSHVEDATLRSVHFIDTQEGWAVGDEGVILHTIDGGRHWERQSTGTRASLRSVHFLTAFVGWAVGREELPYGMGSVGVVLFTRDGGLEWKKQLPNTLPGLNQVRFADHKIGFLLGDGSDPFPSGIFKTIDAGKTWEPIPGPRTTSWLAGDFYTDGKTGVLAGAWSRFAVLADNKCTLAEHADWLAGRDITSLQILGKKTLAVGQGGLILTSVSTGKAWNFAETKLPTEVLANLDFNALCSTKEHVWIVGRPGSVLLHSGDGGATWDLRKTKQALPLHGVFFFDEKVGYAVGDAGTILASKDGGRSWTIQHQAGKHAAAMTIHSLNKNAPVDTVALLGAADGYLTTSLRITAPDPAVTAWDRLQDARRYSFAMRQAGALTGETLWHFPMPQHLERCDKKTILAHWNQLHAKRAEEELMRQLVLSLRVWRPDILVSEHPDSKIPLSALLGEAVQEAVRRAADAKAFPEQIAELGLEPWQVRKVYGLGEGTGDALRQDNDEARPILEVSVRDFAAAAHGLLTERYTPLPRERMHYLLNGGNQKTVERHWLEGIKTEAGVNKRDIKINDKTDAKLAQHLAQRRSVISMAENLGDPARTFKLIPQALDELPDEHAAPAAFAIAGRYAERGQWYLAQESYLYLVDRFPAHPLSAEAYRWLLRLNTSNEARRRHELKHFALAEPIGIARKNGTALPKDKIIQVDNKEPVLGLLRRPETRDWNKGSTEWMRRLAGYGPIWSFDPRAQFCLQSARRQLGDMAASQDAMAKFRKFVPSGTWHDAAAAELWTSNRVLPPPRRLGKARYTEVRPYLDGKFDDPCWQNMKPMVLDNAVGATTKEYVTEAMFAFDQEFLYIALKCTHPAGQQVAPVKPRPRDAAVDPFDRVSILLDLDRDYATYYHLEVDQRGCLRDSCWGDKNWNPRWFVAVHSTETCWQIEAAIPLAELTPDGIKQGTVWAFNVVRVLPGRGVQSWSLPADVEPRPEGMSLLLFQTGAARPMPMP
jgi:photosystem II stability/assembly factor-like uncharacterized protein